MARDVRRDSSWPAMLDFRAIHHANGGRRREAARKSTDAKLGRVFSKLHIDRDGVGLDWKLWCERGYVDFVCPMDYTPHNAGLRTGSQQIVWARQTPCYPGIGLSTWSDTSDHNCSV
jgi:hypothetical protein